MAEILKRNKALAVNPLKASQPVGASLAFLGINKAIPMLHGSQGCTAFGKVFFVRHFREPIPLQTTAMDQVSTVMSADENVILGLKAVCEKSKPALIGLPTTGLSETQGTDIKRLVKDFYAAHPEFAHIPVVPVNTPDFSRVSSCRWRSLLRAAAARVRPGGTLVYSVCTVNADESEAVVDASGLAVDGTLAEEWPAFRHPRRPEFLQTLPHVHGTSGFFVARLRT